MEHLILNNGSDGAALAEVALKALREARKSKTSNSGSVFVSDGQTDDNGISLGTGTIINGVNGGIQPWVGDTTPPGKPTGITAESHNGAIWVSWDGTLDGGIPADFDHVQFMAVDGSKTVDMGQLRAAGKVTAAELTAGDTVTITAIAYDDAHDAQGKSTPNASTQSDPVTVVVQSAVDAADVQKAHDDAQAALNQAGQAKSAADTAMQAAQGAQTTADGKNKIFSSASEPSHTGIVPGDLWFQLDSNKNVTGIQVWNGSAFTDMVLLGNELLVTSSVGTTQIADNAITTGKISANAVTALQIAAQSITGDKLDVGSVAAAIITSGLFKTSDGSYGFDSTNGFWAGDTSGMHMALTGSSNGSAELAIMHGTDVISSLSFVDTISTDGYVHTRISTGQGGQFLEFATLVDNVNYTPDALSYDARLVAAGGTGRMFIDAQNAVNVSGTWFAHDLASLPTMPRVVGNQGTIGFAGGVKYVFNGGGAWVKPTDLVSMLGHGQWYNDYTYQMSGEIIGRTCFLTIRIVRTAADWTGDAWASAQILTIPEQYTPLVSDVNIPAGGAWGWGFQITSDGISVRPFLDGTFHKNSFLSAVLSWQFQPCTADGRIS